MTNFQRRALTATVFTAVMLIGLFWHEASFYLLFFIVSMGCLWEFLRMTTDENKLGRILVMCVGAFFFCAKNLAFHFTHSESFYLDENINYPKIFSEYIHWFEWLDAAFYFGVFLGLIFELYNKSAKPFQNTALAIMGGLYTVFPFTLISGLSSPFFLNRVDNVIIFPSLASDVLPSYTPNIVAGILFLTWANDTGAYLVGSRIGKTPLFPRISPKKTWEGTIGGGIMCILTGFAIHYFLGILTLTDWLIIGVIVAVFGTIGDLIESMLKRSVGVKDSGSFMPGHGGFLDRFDAFIFAIPFVFLYLMVR
jgi:phosphatidate cytidylyltransferase